MPLYEYVCDDCQVLYQVRHGMRETPLQTCQRCDGAVKRKFSAPNLNLRNHSSPTAAKYANMSPQEEMEREQDLQRHYETVWLPPPVKHNPWDEGVH